LEPQFTPDGSSLIYTGGTNRHPVIWIVPVAGGESRLLIGPGWNMRDTENGSLSPDGSLVTFLVHQIGGSEVTMVGGQRWAVHLSSRPATVPCPRHPALLIRPDEPRAPHLMMSRTGAYSLAPTRPA
jgi:hypothetical protein